MTKVYVVEHGEYSQRMVYGIYSTLEKAMASEPGAEWKQRDDWVNDTWVPGSRRWDKEPYDSTTIEAYDLD